MKTFPKNIKFKYDWRKYQKRVLDELSKHLDDNHLHIVAPPGSGKTILGLEVAIRLNKPTLIFAPTIAIRNQWIQRFLELFLLEDSIPDWISTDIKNPKFLTVVTYQSLHSAISDKKKEEEDINDEEEIDTQTVSSVYFEQLVQNFRKLNLGTIIIDEAHHMKNAWWQSLTKLKKSLNTTVVGLTATPPYDVSYYEWQRYIELNGHVDAEITVPELIQEGDLCPHQDLIYASLPTQEEIEKIYEYRDKVRVFYEELKTDDIFKNILMRHRYFVSPRLYVEEIYGTIEYYSSILIFLNATGIPIPDEHREIIDNEEVIIPDLNYNWLEILLTNFLFKDVESIETEPEYNALLQYKLKKIGVLEKQVINFRYSPKINAYLSTSISKLKSITEIVKQEYQHLKNDLRLVILTDYIRKEFLHSNDETDINKMGVIPVFEMLRRESLSDKLGVLTGTIVVIPRNLFVLIKDKLCPLKEDDCTFSVLEHDDRYIQISMNEKVRNGIVHTVTELFQKGEIEILIGTKSLLGEGWDAPAINSLILASFVGSYVTSNQMRGRAIRSVVSNPDKTANVWHLLSIDPTSPDGGEDFQILKRRFKTFVGISHQTLTIENGIDRLHVPTQFDEENLQKFNDTSLSFAKQRTLLKDNWLKAVVKGTVLIEEIKVPFRKSEDYYSVKKLYYRKTIKNLLFGLSSVLVVFSYELLYGLIRNFVYFKSLKSLVIFLVFTFGVGALHYGRLTYKTLKTYIKYRDIAKDLHHVAYTLLFTLIKMRQIQTPVKNLMIYTELDEQGAVFCHLKGGNTFERSVFIHSLKEILETIKNPRYIIVRKSVLMGIISQNDYHAIPEIIGKNKKNVLYFQQMWQDNVGKNELIFTRNTEGRRLLLKARMQSLSAVFEEQTNLLNKWR